jgi:RimJ/RimL family protein N-acetyltransferase
MITTEFLPVQNYPQFKDWLEIQDDETRQLYFGVAGSQFLIDSLMERVTSDPDHHHFLVAKNGKQWAGTIHIATYKKSVEFGIIVHEDYRGQGIANQMMDQALVWARNRGYKDLYMHCLGWNKPIQHLCRKHGLETSNMLGDTEAELKLPPANWITINKEFVATQRNIYHRWLQNNRTLYQELYG